MKSILSKTLAMVAIAACLTLSVQAKPIHSVPVDTGKMKKMDKMDKMKTPDKMKTTDKMAKKMSAKKMKKDSSKMSKM